MPAIALKIEFKGETKFTELQKVLEQADKLPFAERTAADVEELTRSHIAKAAQTRHKTAAKLGATPTGYLTKKASSVEAVGSPGKILLTVSGEIFKRTFQPVTVTAVAAKMLTIPWAKEAYGRRAREFDGLFVYQSKGGAGPAFLARRVNGKMQFLFLLKRSVVLPQDRGLLPSETDIFKTVEASAETHLDEMIRKLTSGS